MTSYNSVTYSVEGGIAEILIDRPDVLNAFNNEVVEELVGAINEARNDDAVYVIVLSGRGRAFCAGVDTEEVLGPAQGRDRLFNELRLTKVRRVQKDLYNVPKPTIAAINGPALGGGVSFALSCDFRVMSENAFLRDQHLNIGVTPGAMEAWLLPKLVGESKAKEFVYLSRDITPEEATECDLVLEVTDEGEALPAARDLAAEIRDKPALAVQQAKELFSTPYGSLEAASEASFEMHWEALQDPEQREAIDALEEGREPDFDREY